jgi:hypothetical protein
MFDAVFGEAFTCAFNLEISSDVFPFTKVELFQSTYLNVREQTSLGILFMSSAISPFSVFQ